MTDDLMSDDARDCGTYERTCQLTSFFRAKDMGNSFKGDYKR